MSEVGEKVAVVTQGPWLGRDGFVAETAVRFDRVQASIARLEREAEKAQQVVEELAEDVRLMHRFESFEHSKRNSRDNKLQEMEQTLKAVKARLDAIEGKRSTFVGLTHKTFESIDRKLEELSALQAHVAKSDRYQRLCAIAFVATFMFAGAVVAYHFI